MEENKKETKEEVKEEKKKTTKKSGTKKTETTKKKVTVNNRFSEVLDKIEIEAEKQKSTQKEENTNENKTGTNKITKKNTEKKTNITSKTKTKNGDKQSKVKENLKTKKDEKNVKKESKAKKTKKIEDIKITKDSEELKEIEDAIKEQKKMPKTYKEMLNKTIFENIFIANIIMLYFVFVNIGAINIPRESYIIDLQVFSITLIVTTIVIFEKAYKKDSGKITIHGIEILILSIITMLLPMIFNKYNSNYSLIINMISMIYAVYYVGKSIIIYLKVNKKTRERDAKKISKKIK